jgi:hypothetical protein
LMFRPNDNREEVPVNWRASKDQGMRGSFASAIAIVTMVPSILLARSDEIPTLDVRPVCSGIAKQSTHPNAGKKGQAETFRGCMESEQGVREQLKNVWLAFSPADKGHCIALAKTGGLPSYTELITCLEMVRDVRTLRSAHASPSAADTTKPTSSSAVLASQSTPTKEPAKAEAAVMSTELEQARTDAQTARASEASAQRKLADVEAVLRGAKDKADQATAEAEQAKADAQAARGSAAAVKRKLAEVEAARESDEKACLSSSRPGFAARLRELFKRSSSKNP